MLVMISCVDAIYVITSFFTCHKLKRRKVGTETLSPIFRFVSDEETHD
jgi:hypothetical protein